MNANRLQNLGTITALIISVIALVTSIYEANIMKSQQEAMVWPYFGITPTYNSKGFAFTAYNHGTGPALIKSIEVTYDGIYTKSFDDLLDKVKPDRKIGYDRLKMSELNNTVLKAGYEENVFFMPWDDETRAIAKELTKVNFKVQYSSILGDYWLFDMKAKTHQKKRFQAKIEFKN